MQEARVGDIHARHVVHGAPRGRGRQLADGFAAGEASVRAPAEADRGPGRGQELGSGGIDAGIGGEALVLILRRTHPAHGEQGAGALETGKSRQGATYRQGKTRCLCHATSGTSHHDSKGTSGRGGYGGEGEGGGTGGRTRGGGEGCGGACGQASGRERNRRSEEHTAE